MRVPLTVNDFLERAVSVYGNRVGVVDESDQPASSWGSLTWAAVGQRARALAAGLDQLGVDRGERVAIVSHNAARLLTAVYGVSGWGRAIVPINFRLNAEEVAYIIEDVGASVLLVDPELEGTLAAVKCRHRFVLGEQSDGDLLAIGREPEPWSAPDEDAPATINYTSGTTARPKGVELTHRNIWLNAVTLAMHMQVSDRDVYLHTLPLFHVNGWGMVHGVTGLGGRHVLLRKIDGAEILRRVDRHGVTLLCAAPAVVNAVLDAAKDLPGPVPGHGRVRLLVAGAPPPTTTIERVQTELGWEFNQLYGLTETSPLVTINRSRAEWDALDAAERAARLSRAGVPALGVAVRLSSDGEVLVRSNHVFAGYWKQAEASEQALADGWFHTGDGGDVADDGYLSISDRKKDVIISGGENVSSIEVENCLFAHPAVSEAAAIGVPDSRWGETVLALVVLRDGTELTEAELIEHCRRHMAHFKCPTRVEFRPSLPRTATGKLQKFRLRAPYWVGEERQI